MKDLLLVGSIPLETVTEVFEIFGRPLGPHLACLSDGEVGFKRHWIGRVHFQVFAIHPDIEVLRQPSPDDCVERLNPRDVSDSWQFKVKSGVQRIRFGEPGWRLGFARDAVTSYFAFRTFKDKGVLPPHLRFQVCIPMVNSAAPLRIFADAASCEKVRAGYAEALSAELEKILEKIPHDELAIQWDCATELQEAYRGAVGEQVSQTRVSSMLPREVALGLHLCFGTLGGWPRFAPDDLGAAVELANAFIGACGRAVDWTHIPVLDRSDDAFFAPLRSLRPDGARLSWNGAQHGALPGSRCGGEEIPKGLRRRRVLRLRSRAARGNAVGPEGASGSAEITQRVYAAQLSSHSAIVPCRLLFWGRLC